MQRGDPEYGEAVVQRKGKEEDWVVEKKSTDVNMQMTGVEKIC